LLRLGTGRHSKQFATGDPIKSLKSTLFPDESDSDEEGHDGDGTIDPELWADNFMAHGAGMGSAIVKIGADIKKEVRMGANQGAFQLATNLNHVSQFDISDNESEDDDDIESTLPLVSDMLMRPYMINQTMTKSASDSLGISTLMETSTTNLSMFDKRRRYLVRDSVDFRDKNGKVRKLELHKCIRSRTKIIAGTSLQTQSRTILPH
jgi:hypothetical protein